MRPPGAPPGDPGPARPALSQRERDVLALVAQGLTNPEIGRRLYISHHTVKEYLSSAMRKLGVSSRLAAVLATADGAVGARPGDASDSLTALVPPTIDVESGPTGPLPGLGADISIPTLKLRLNLTVEDLRRRGEGLDKTSIPDHRSKGP